MAAPRRALVGLLAALAVSPSAWDAAVEAATPVRRFVRRAPLELFAPETGAPLLSLLPVTLAIPCHYTGDGEVAFSLLQGPAGMAVDGRSGLVSWTPPLGAEGTSVAVRVAATDGTLSDELAFTLEVAATQPLASAVAASTLTITAPGTLTGVSFAFPGSASPPAAQAAASLVAPAAAPELPAGVTRVSDFFRLSPAVSPEAPIVVTAPARLVPAGRLPERLRLMVHTARALDTDGPLWVATWAGLDVLPSGAVTMEAGALGELSCFAVADEQSGAAAAAAPVPGVAALGGGRAAALAAATTCAPLVHSRGTADAWRQVCTVAGDPPLTIVFKNLGLNRWQPAPTAAGISGWLVAARETATSLGMGTGARVEVEVEATRSDWGGFTERAESYRVLHLNEQPIALEAMQAIVAHEYFHHAQANTRVSGLNNLLWDAGETRLWLTEGTARWFEDVVFDDLDSYAKRELEPLPDILCQGLAAVPVEGVRETREYSRFAFFKLVSSRCPSLDLATAFNTDLAWDDTGIDALAASLAPWGCSFAAGLAGVDTSSLGAALLEYAYATTGRNNMGWLDDDEAPFSFADLSDTLYPDKACTIAGDCPIWAGRTVNLAPAGVIAFRIEGVNPLPANTKAEVMIYTLGTPVKAWVGNDETGTLTSGRWYTVDGIVSHVYGGTRAPRLLVLLVHEGLFGAPTVGIRARLQSTVPVDVVTPFDFAWSYAAADPVIERDLHDHVIWSATATGSVTAPETATVGPASLPWDGDTAKRVRVCVPNTAAFTLKASATLQATRDQDPRRIPHPTIPDSWLNWEYSNPHLKIFLDDPNGSISGDTISFTVPVVKGAWFSKTLGGCVAYRLEKWITDKDGVDGPRSANEDVCQAAVHLDLSVGSPPPGC